MLPAWRLKLREAKVALKGGRLDEASNLLREQRLRQFLPAKELAAQVAEKIVRRAEDRIECGESRAAWDDLRVAEQLGGQQEAVEALRRRHRQQSLQEIRAFLVAGEPQLALQQLARDENLHAAGREHRVWKQVAQLMRTSREQASRGRFLEAKTTLERARSLVSGEDTMALATQLERQCLEMDGRSQEHRELTERLHSVLVNEQWNAVLSTAQRILDIAPQDTAALEARRRAWQAVDMEVTKVYQRVPVQPRPVALGDRPRVNPAKPPTEPGLRSPEVDTLMSPEAGQRMLVWADAVGGFLVCLGDTITIGQPTSGVHIDIPILADLSRRHAVIRREHGAYVLEPLHDVRISGRTINSPTVLEDNQRIELGRSVVICFRKPHALSATARLTIESHHKMSPNVDAIILMADSCVMGPSNHDHVVCRDWPSELVLFRQGDGLKCRAGEPLTIDGEPTGNEADLADRSRIEGDHFCVSFEPL